MALRDVIEARLRLALPNDPERTVRNPPSISIVTPNFNDAAYIESTLQSVLEQSYPKLEYVVVDGGSTDGSKDILGRYESQLTRYISEPDRGHADALNKGFRDTTGEIMGWLNSDDLLLPGSLNVVAEVFAKYPEVQWITGHPSAVYPDGSWKLHARRNWSRLRFLNGDYLWIQQESTFWRRSLWERAGAKLASELDLAVDLELWTRFFRHAELYPVDVPVAAFRYREGQRSSVHRDRYESEAHQVVSNELDQLDANYRKEFSDWLPESLVPINPPIPPDCDLRLSICDPPLITLEAMSQRAEASAADAEYLRTLRHQADSLLEVPSPLSGFRNRHRGERCFIMGNGPSLNKMDLNLLAGETVFCCNSIFLLFDRIAWRPTYYTCVDSRVLPDRAGDIDEMLSASTEITAFFPCVVEDHTSARTRTPIRKIIPPGPNRYYFQERFNEVTDDPFTMFSADIDEYVVQPYTVAITMLQLAVYMGFKDVYLIGCDTDYTVPKDIIRESGSEIALTSRTNSDANHFDPRYFGAGRKWHDPQTDMMIEHHKHAKKACDLLGVKVINATVGGKLEVYPRVEFDALFPPHRN